MTTKEPEKIVEEICHRLMEHFEHVQILASRQTKDGQTEAFKWGRGNWFARQGMAQAFISLDISQDMAKRIASELTDKDSGEDWKSGAEQ